MRPSRSGSRASPTGTRSHGYGAGDLRPTRAPTAADDVTDIELTCLWAHGGMVSTLQDMHVWMSSMESPVDPDAWARIDARYGAVVRRRHALLPLLV